MIKRISIGVFLVLIPTIGVFINRLFGWFLITSFIYFIISFITFWVMDSSWTDIKNPEMGIVYIIVSVLPIIIMNKEKIRNDIYSIPKTDMLTKNIIASIIGMGITIIITYLNQ